MTAADELSRDLPRMSDQDVIRWAREKRPNDPRIIESGTADETDASIAYIWDELMAEGEIG